MVIATVGITFLVGLIWGLMKGCNKEVQIAATETLVMVDTAKVEATAPVIAGEQMDRFAPVILCFDNDEPNKNSEAVTTSQTYSQTFNKYENR